MIKAYRPGHQTLEQTREKFKQKDGFELPSHATIFRYSAMGDPSVETEVQSQ